MTKGLVVAEIRELELRLEGVDYPFEAVLMRINRLGISCATGGESRKGGRQISYLTRSWWALKPKSRGLSSKAELNPCLPAYLC